MQQLQFPSGVVHYGPWKGLWHSVPVSPGIHGPQAKCTSGAALSCTLDRHLITPLPLNWVQHAAFVEEKQTAHLFAQCQPPAISQWAAGRGVVHPHQPVCTAGHIGAFHDSSSSLPLISSGVQGVCLSFFFLFLSFLPSLVFVQQV